MWSVWNRRWTGVAAALLAVLIGWTQADLHVPRLVAALETEGPRITVFNWNTQYWASDAERTQFFEYLRARDTDVYHLQEHLDPTTRQPPNDDSELARAFPGYSIHRSGELLTLSRLPVLATWMPPDRTMLRVDVLVDGQTVHLYNVHVPVQIIPRAAIRPQSLLADVDARFDRRARELAGLATDIATDDAPLIASGDFNSSGSMGVMEPILTATEDAAVATGDTWPRTWPSWGPRLWRIDYVLSAHGLTALRNDDIDPLGFSDHWGQRTVLALPPAGELR